MSATSLEDEIDRLEKFRRQLCDAIDEIEHEMRRCADVLERTGGSSAAQQRMLELRRNRDLNIEDYKRASSRIERLRTSPTGDAG